MDRRHFHKLCGSLLGYAAGGAAGLPTLVAANTPYQPTQLLFEDDSPVTLDSLQTGDAFIFSYPYRTTPCFLVKLSTSAKAAGPWPGGVDDNFTVVAYSAICSHKMSHPAKPISHISYRHEPVTFYDKKGNRQDKAGLISCCSERSVYDPGNAGEVLSGPAPVPLAAITLDVDDNGVLSAVGSVGPDQYERFLDKFGFRLAMEYGVSDVRARTGETTTVVAATDFSKQQVLC